jgi:hypothetical protein
MDTQSRAAACSALALARLRFFTIARSLAATLHSDVRDFVSQTTDRAVKKAQPACRSAGTPLRSLTSTQFKRNGVDKLYRRSK